MIAKAIFEDTYIIRQVVQETESSISMSTVKRKTLDYDERRNPGKGYKETISTTKSLILAQDER